MSATESTMLALGTQVPSFSLLDATSGKIVSVEDLTRDAPNGLLVMFICNHCPYVKHIADCLAVVGRDLLAEGFAVAAISSNDAERYPEDSPAELAAEARRRGYPFPYLYDETQKVAHQFHAACTPEMYLFDGQGKLVYRGQFDESRPRNRVTVTGSSVRAAAQALLSGSPPVAEQIPSIGCNIKWKPGNEPSY